MLKRFVKSILVFVAAVAVFLIGFSFGQNKNEPLYQAPVPEQAQAVALVINNGEFVTGYPNLTLPEPATVLALLEQASQREDFPLEVDKSSSLGAFVKQIGDKANGQDQRYWQYWVDGEQPQVAADRYALQGGETVLWTFSKSAR
ncbi:MAG: DUF4430 domain-containing protein [Candidatus Veblenbacteria bacterium]|nr:DUF4430 domain-containing protein [Candidatus Veblenbacteria bacterium]